MVLSMYCLFLSGFLTYTLYTFQLIPIRATFPVNLMILGFIIPIVLDEEYNT
jgi:hypothetical protein